MRKIPEFFVIIVEPKYEGNVGAITRTMMNFGFGSLFLVNPCELGDDCYRRAMHADRILDDAKVFSCFDDAIKNIDFLVATSSISGKTDKKHLRNALMLKDFVNKIHDVDGKVGLIFGREDYGLYNEEIAKCDVLVKIPTTEEYSSLNLSHAVNLVLYEIYVCKNRLGNKTRKIGRIEKEKLYEYFSELLESINYPEHKKDNTKIMFKRIMGRAMPSKWEYHTLMGVISETLKKIKK